MRRWWWLALWIVVPGCTKIAPSANAPSAPLPKSGFSHEAFDRVLREFVDERGRVDYARLQTGRNDLDRYWALLARFSPDSHSELFPDDSSRLAYWINAYNAVTIEIVLHHYPIDSVLDVGPPKLLFFFPGKSGFFYFQRFVLGGKKMSLHHLENEIIRQRFDEPRVHFALNCASGGCPILPRRAFTAESLDSELDRETRRFLTESRNFRIDHERKTILLSEIFDWYRDDFTAPAKEASLLDYVKGHIGADGATELERSSAYAIEFTPYDWRLNGQRRLTSAAN